MAENLVNKYIEITKKQIIQYLKNVFENKIKKDIVESFIEKYINIRYYNFYNDDINSKLRTRILDHLKEEGEKLSIYNIEDREFIENCLVFFYYVLYFDKVIQSRDIRKTIEKIAKLRKRVLGKENEKEFIENLYSKMLDYDIEKDNLIVKYETDEFGLKFTNYQDKLDVYRVNLKYNFQMPLIYSEFAINKAFNTGLINEDKLQVEYNLISMQVLKDILKQDFKKQYVLEFSDTLLDKPKKLKTLLNILNNQGEKDKLSIKIRYEKFLEKKEEIYELLREGFRVTAILDNSFTIDYKNIENLKIFKYIIINKNLKCYKEIARNKKNLNNVIEV